MTRIRTLAALAAPLVLVGWLGFDFASLQADEAIERRLCPLIETSARTNDLPVPYLTKLLFRESRFRPDAVSWSGAQGVAQFLPRTAAALGLRDPFDPEQAVPAAARYLAALRKRFGNLGLAAAAYNGGETRLAAWLAGKGELKDESRTYVAFITGRGVEDWRGLGDAAQAQALPIVNVALRADSSASAAAPGRAAGPDDVMRSLEVQADSGSEPTCLQLAAVLRAPAPVTSVAALFKGSRSGPAIMRAVESGPRRAARPHLANAPSLTAGTRPPSAAKPAIRSSVRIAGSGLTAPRVAATKVAAGKVVSGKVVSGKVAAGKTWRRVAVRTVDGRTGSVSRTGWRRQREAARRSYAALRPREKWASTPQARVSYAHWIMARR